jgi:acyl-CoA thioesterase-1
MRAAPNLGPQYIEQFESIYPRVASRSRIPLVPFLLEGVAAVPQMNQGDGIHPNVAGHRRTADNVWEILEPALREAAAAR